MQLDQFRLDQFQTWLQEKDISNKCSACGGQEWDVKAPAITFVLQPNNVPFELTIHPDGTSHLQIESLGYVARHCRNCGYTMLFDATKLGLVPPQGGY